MKMNPLKMMGAGLTAMPWLTRLMLLPAQSDVKITNTPTWEEEKEDILERANYLSNEIICRPEELVKKMPAVIGDGFSGEWAIYCCSMLAHAFANISVIYPDKREACLQQIPKLIDIVNTPIIRQYDTTAWHEDAISSLAGRKSHMTYLSILAWMITNYRLIGGDSRYDTLLDQCCEALVRRMKESPFDLNLLSFPRKQIFIADMMVTIVALHNYARLNGGKYQDMVDAWLNNAKQLWTMKKTGLIAAMLPGESSYCRSAQLRGSSSALICSYLSMVDSTYAREQYEKMMRHLYGEAEWKGETVYGVREYLHKNPQFAAKPGDAGLVIKGLSAGGTAFAIGASTLLGDWEFRSKVLRTADLAGGTVCKSRMRHYRMGEMFMVGEATMLAMRTNIER